MRSGQDVLQSYAVDNNEQDFANGGLVTDAQDIASDALSTQPAYQAQVLDDLSSSASASASDDGGAVMQTVHDVALDASLASFTADNSEQGFSEPDFANSTVVTNAQDIAFDALNAPQVSTWQSSMTLSENPGGAPTAMWTGGEGIVGYHPLADTHTVAPADGNGVAVGSAALAPAPADLAILVNPVEGPFEGPITHTGIGPNGATPVQVQQALDESGLSVNGAGVTVGVLSDSFNNLGGATADEADGALPSASHVHILSDLSSGGTDEGRAMMQIVHDVAPGANLDFYTAFNSEQDFADGILALAAAGCKVICDDVSYFDEPFFQNGVVAQAIQTVEAEGVTYLTAAGNDASNAYQAAWTPISGTFDGHSFTDAESFGGSLAQTLTLGFNSSFTVPVLLEWNQPYGSATSDLEVFVFNSNGQLAFTVTNAADGEPTNPWVDFDLTAGNTYHIVIENLSGPDPGLIKEIAAGDGIPATFSVENVGTVYGHAMTPSAITVGAVDSANTPAFGVSPAVSETFSSSGLGTELLFDNNGIPLSSPDLLSPVAVSGVDDINTTVSGGLSDFFGTSAATPSIAGVVALMLQANPNLTPTQIDQILQASTTSMANAAVSGAGLVQANVAVADALAAINTPTVTESLVSDTGSSSSDKITSNDALTGGGDPNATVTIKEGATTLGTATANGSGTWTFNPSLSDGAHTIVASETTAGNTGSASLTFTLDTTAPTVTESLVSDTGSSSSDKITSNDALTGGGDPNATVTIKEGATTLGTATANGSGTWTFSPTLSDGAHTIVASETDTAGNTGSASLTFTLDTTAPTVTESLVSDTGSSSSDKITSNDALTGGGDPNATVTIKEGATTLGTATANGSGTWTFNPTLSDGAHTIVASETDTAGNTGSASLTFTLDTTAPTVAVSGASSTLKAGQTDLITFTFSQAVAGFDNADVSVSGGTLGTISQTDAKHYTATFTPTAQVNQTANIQVVVSGTGTSSWADLAGNAGTASNTFSITENTIAPVVTESLVSDTGSSSSDSITSKDALTGSGDPSATVHFTVDGKAIVSTTTANSSGVWTFTPTGLADGVHTVVASETSGAGTASLTFTLDTTAPKVTESLFSDTGSSSTDKITSNDELTGSGDPNALVTFKQGTTTLGTTSADGTGHWTFTPSGLADGAHTIVASETDVAGNIGTASLTFTLDTTAPKVTESLKTDTGSSTSDKITSNDAVTGTADANAVIHFTVDGNPIATTVTAGRTGAWSFTPTGLADGTHTILATETDAVSNIGTASLTFTLDKTAPVPTFTSEVLNANNTVTFTGTSTAEANDKISIFDGKTVLGTTTTANDGTWSFTTSAESTSKAHTFTATATDLAGNIGHSSNEAVLGSTKADTLSGTSGNDFIIGTLGADKITGGAGADTFIYNVAADSTPSAHDTITGFTHGVDIIDLTNIPGITASGGVPTFQGQLSGAGSLTLNANSVAYIEVSGNTEVLVNTTNSAETVTTSSVTAANMEIVLAGISLGLTSADFYHA